MKRNLLSNFVFLNVKFSKYRYTDNRNGSPLNYLAYIKKGSAKITSSNDTISINEGDLFFIPKNLAYQSYWYGNDEIDFLSCGFHSILTGQDMNYKLQLVLCDREIKQQVQNIFSGDKVPDCNGLSIFYDVMAKVIPTLKCDDESKEMTFAERIKEGIEKKPHAPLREIAKMCAISESYMYEVFKKAIGETPNEYKQKVLCEEGIELLLTTNKKIEEISEIAGFSSSSYFRKVLKKHTGSTPSEIRKNRGF